MLPAMWVLGALIVMAGLAGAAAAGYAAAVVVGNAAADMLTRRD